MTKNSIAVCIGLNSVNPAKYNNWSGNLNACEADAQTMSGIATASGFSKVIPLLTEAATRDTLLSELSSAASVLESGDIFMLSYSGHGGQMPDLNGDENEDDSQDETWCLYDGELVDDELFATLQLFKKGVRIIAFADSCHSGSSLKQMTMNAYYMSELGHTLVTPVNFSEAVKAVPQTSVGAFKAMPDGIAYSVYDNFRSFYDPILSNPAIAKAKNNIEASVLFFAACQDNQFSRDGIFNGVFTGHLRSVWNAGKFSGNYNSFAKSLRKGMRPDQTPRFSRLGTFDKAFLSQKPFTV